MSDDEKCTQCGKDHTDEEQAQCNVAFRAALNATLDSFRAATRDQSKPTPNDSGPIWELVIADMQARDTLGRERYGTPLQAFNGRDALVDAYQESLDLSVYLRQEIEERATRKRRLAASFQTDTLQPVEPPEPLPPALLRSHGTLRIGVGDLMDLLTTREFLRAQVNELQCSHNAVVEQRRRTTRARVREFFTVMGQELPERVSVPDDKTVQLRAKLVVEETLELVESLIADDWKPGVCSVLSPFETTKWLRDALNRLLVEAELSVDLPAFADACTDIDYVVEGARLAFGIDGEPIMKLVHEANLKKLGGPIRESDGKRLKPEGWQPPDVEGALIAQGWRP